MIQTSFADDLLARYYKPVKLSDGARECLHLLREQTKPIKQPDLAKELKVTPSVVRGYFKQLRRAGYLILATKRGCWLATNQTEIDKWRQGYESRALSILGTLAAIRKRSMV